MVQMILSIPHLLYRGVLAQAAQCFLGTAWFSRAAALSSIFFLPLLLILTCLLLYSQCTPSPLLARYRPWSACHYRLFLPVLEFLVSEIIQNVFFCVCLLSFSIMFLRSIHGLVCISLLSLFIVKQYPIVCISHCVVSHYPVDGHFELLTIQGYDRQSCHEQLGSNLFVDTYFYFPWEISRSRIAESQNNCVFNSLRNCQIIF